MLVPIHIITAKSAGYFLLRRNKLLRQMEYKK